MKTLIARPYDGDNRYTLDGYLLVSNTGIGIPGQIKIGKSWLAL